MIQVTRERANYTTYTKEATYLQEMLDDLERALNLAGYDVSIVFDKQDYVIEASNLKSYTHTLLHLKDDYPEAGRGDYRKLVFDILEAIRDVEN
jgi:hypothetical protein